MEQKQYPIGLPVWWGNKAVFIENIDAGEAYVKLLYSHKWVKLSELKPLTEAEYFKEVMQPQGWKVSGNEQYFANEETELFIHRSPNYTVQHKYHINAFTRHMLGTISEALDHSEALQAISKYENS